MVIKDKVINSVAKALGCDIEEITEHTSSSDLPEWDSFGHLTILSQLDEDLGEDYRESDALATASSVKEILDALNGNN